MFENKGRKENRLGNEVVVILISRFRSPSVLKMDQDILREG